MMIAALTAADRGTILEVYHGAIQVAARPPLASVPPLFWRRSSAASARA